LGVIKMSRRDRKIFASPRFQDVERVHVQEKLDMGEIVRRQVLHCLMVESDPHEFAVNVMRLESLIPTAFITDEYIEEVLSCKDEYVAVHPQFCCGVPVKESAIPAIRENVVEWNWYGRFTAAINLFHNMGIGFKKETIGGL